MRLVFWFFLLLNLAFFYWQYSQPQKLEPPLLQTEVLPPGVESLVLLRERGLGTATQTVPKTPQPASTQVGLKPITPAGRESARAPLKVEALPELEPPPAIVLVCFTLGPLKDEAEAGRMYKALLALDVKAEQRLSERQVLKGYWVFLPPFKSYADARRKVLVLQEKGLDDMYIMGKGEVKNAISLGLFTRKSTATARLNQVRRMDSAAMMKPRYRAVKEKWLDLSVDSAQTEKIAGIAALADQQPGVELVQRKTCK
ncbi:MAG TPA: hypothetical protein ENI94_01865 [Gammaproteobacteria bacterium]|nr:hypothetical protein [Gammaproteobacteria bacterium]